MLLIASTFTCKVIGLSWFRRLVPSLKISPANRNIRCACGKSFTDDLVASGYCKRESKLCLTIRWGFCRVLRFVLPDLELYQRFAGIHYSRPPSASGINSYDLFFPIHPLSSASLIQVSRAAMLVSVRGGGKLVCFQWNGRKIFLIIYNKELGIKNFFFLKNCRFFETGNKNLWFRQES